MKYEIIGQSAQDSDNVAANPSRLLNCYREPVQMGGRTRFAIKGVLGQEFKNNTAGTAVRAMDSANSLNWVVANGGLYEMASGGALTLRSAVADDAETTISGNQSDVTVVSGGNYYLWDGVSISQPGTLTFGAVGAHTYVGGYTVLTEQDGKRFQWTALGDASTLNALDFASAEQVDDKVIRPIEYRGNLYLMGEESFEVWQISGTGSEAFSYVTTQNLGLKSFNLLSRFRDELIFVANDGRIYWYQTGVISTAAVETSIAQNTPTHCWYYEDEGRKFFVLRFSDRPAWCFDLTTREWHERGEGPGFSPWRSTASVQEGVEWFIGNDDGEILKLARTSQDLSGNLYRQIIGHTLHTGDRFSIKKIELLGRVGEQNLTDAVDFVLGIGSGDTVLGIGPDTAALGMDQIDAGAREGVVDLFESRDGGKTWKGPYDRSMGLMGEYESRMVWRARGQYRQYTPRWDFSDPADVTFYADAVVE